MVLESILCSDCASKEVIKHGKTPEGKRRYRCQNSTCTRSTFIRDYSDAGASLNVKQQICDMAMNGLWWAIDHVTGQVLAYVLATHEDEAFLRLKALLEPFGMMHFYSDGWGAYERHIEPVFPTVGKRHTQKIERKHLTLRTRIKRLAGKTICFSKSIVMHDVVIGLFINRFEFGLSI